MSEGGYMANDKKPVAGKKGPKPKESSNVRPDRKLVAMVGELKKK
jgi:hypothetical protein